MAHHAHTPEVHEHADAWHHHSKAEGLPQVEHLGVVSTAALAKWLVLIIIGLTAVLIALFVYFTSAVTQLKSEMEESTALGEDARKARAAAMAALGQDGATPTYAWTDRQKGNVQIPIAQAMDKVIVKYQTRGK